jgi:hypothetical protein
MMKEIIKEGSAVISLERLKDLEATETECIEARKNFGEEVKALKYTLRIGWSNYHDYNRTRKVEVTRDESLNVVPVEFFEEFIDESKKLSEHNSEVVCQAHKLNQDIENKYESLGFFGRLKYVFVPGEFRKLFY